MRSERTRGVLLIAVSAAAFGSLAIFARYAYRDGTEPLALLAGRFTIAGAVMLVWMLASRRRWPRGRLLWTLVALGGLGYVGQSFSFFTALTLASASVVSLLLYLYPALVTILAVVFLKESIDRVTVGALIVAVAGSALVVGVGGSAKPVGVMLGLLAAFIYAIYIVVGSRITPQAGAIVSTTIVLLTAAAVFGTVAVVTRPQFPTTLVGWTGITGVAVMSVVAITAFFGGLERLGPADASTLSTLEPVVTVVLANLLLDETVEPIQMVGGLAILGAVIVLSRHRTEAGSEDGPAAPPAAETAGLPPAPG